MVRRPQRTQSRLGGPVATIFLTLLLVVLTLSHSAVASRAALPNAFSTRQTSTSTTFAVIGDYGTDNSNESAVRNLVDSWSPSFIVTVGDNFYNEAMDPGDTGNQYHESTGKYFCGYLKDVAGTGPCPTGTAATNAFFPSMGNHDYSDATPSPGIYTGYFTLPGAGVATTNTSGNERYYDFIQGPVHFFVLNSNSAEPSGTSSTSAQAVWLQAQLAASTSVWNIVLFHHAPFSSDAVHGSTARMQWPFAQWGADVVLSGHAHVYERIMHDGIAYIINGLGGAARYSFGMPVAGSVFRYNADSGTQRVTVSDTSLVFEFISVDGVVQDTYSLMTGPAPTATATATQTPGSAITVSFQNGTSPDPAYAGGDDTFLAQASPGTNFGGDRACKVDGDDPPGTSLDRSCLLRWDLSAIPAGSTVTAASITLNVTNVSAGSYPVYRLLQRWFEAEATWDEYAAGLPWSAAGALGSLDRDTQTLGSIAAANTGLLTFNLNAAGIAVVQAWIDTPASNLGVIIADSGMSDGADFSSNESTTTSNHPKLTVRYVPGSPGSKPTATPTFQSPIQSGIFMPTIYRAN